MPTLYILATPIGNLEDITLRALRVLQEVDIILCEDTRVTKKLLQKYEIDKQLISFHAQSGDLKTEKVLALIEEGKNLALVSDAGTPTISDPGARLVSVVREKFGDEIAIVSIPGPSAVTAALSISGMPSSEFLFLGFLPHKKGRETLFKEIASAERTVVFYESPHRIKKTLESLSEHAPHKPVAICRELTKIHEEVLRGTPSEILDIFTKVPEKVRGEFVVIVGAHERQVVIGV